MRSACLFVLAPCLVLAGLAGCVGSRGAPAAPLSPDLLTVKDEEGREYHAKLGAVETTRDALQVHHRYSLILDDGTLWNVQIDREIATGDVQTEAVGGAQRWSIASYRYEEGLVMQIVDLANHHSWVGVTSDEMPTEKQAAMLAAPTPGILGEAPLSPMVQLTTASLARVGDVDLLPYRAGILLTAGEFLTRWRLGGSSDPEFHFNDANLGEDCRADWEPNGKFAQIGVGGTMFSPKPGINFNMNGWLLWNYAKSKCPTGKSPIGFSGGSGKGSWKVNFKPDGGAACDGIAMVVDGTAVTVVDNKQNSGKGCTQNGEAKDWAEIFSIEAHAKGVPVVGDVDLAWAWKDRSNMAAADLDCNQPQCAGFQGKGWVCLVFQEKANGWIWVPKTSFGVDFPYVLSRDRALCDQWKGVVTP